MIYNKFVTSNANYIFLLYWLKSGVKLTTTIPSNTPFYFLYLSFDQHPIKTKYYSYSVVSLLYVSQEAPVEIFPQVKASCIFSYFDYTEFEFKIVKSKTWSIKKLTSS